MRTRESKPERTALQSSATLAGALLAWFALQARPLPWRLTRDPYAIWVSEIMAQQTQIQTVIPFWTHWMRRLPTVHRLAQSPTDQLHRLWEGLGYYSRVRNMQRAAQIIVEKYQGRFPATFSDLLALPGIGPYTAGAICSIAYDQPVPAVDGNVSRVLARIQGLNLNVDTPQAKKLLWTWAKSLVESAGQLPPPSPSRPGNNSLSQHGNLNQALMELGATVCLPRQPRCDQCPVASHCVAQKTGQQLRLPQTSPRPAIVRRNSVAFVLRHRGQFFVRQRPNNGINSFLWEFPTAQDVDNPETAFLALKLKPMPVHALDVIDHSITRYRFRLRVFLCACSARPRINDGVWVAPHNLSQLPFSSAHRKIAQSLAKPLPSNRSQTKKRPPRLKQPRRAMES